MNELQIFENNEFGQVRTVEENGKVLFCGSDVAKALGYADTPKAIKTHCKSDGWVICPVIDSLGREQQAKFVDEGNVYRLITHSKLPSAEKFESWVFDEVLPTIRKHGAYMTENTMEQVINDPDFGIMLLTQLKVERDKLKQKDKEIEIKNQLIGELKPKADYTDRILQNPGLVNINQIAKDYGMSARSMNKLLEERKIQYKQGKQWLLYKKYQNKGYTSSETIDITRSDGSPDVVMRTKWTQKGRLFIYELLKADGIRPVIETQFNVIA
jgi:prophage antirepressor-like protein